MAQKVAPQRKAGHSRSEGREQDTARFEEQLAAYLQQRIKPGLNRGAIPLVARSIAKDLASRTSANGGGGKRKTDDTDPVEVFEAEMRDLQEELGDDWIVRFSVHGDDAWLTAETEDGSQRLEAPTAGVLVKAAKLLDRAGG